MHLLEFEKPIAEIERAIAKLHSLKENDVRLTPQIIELQKQCENKKREIFSTLSAWQMIQLARHPDRPVFEDLVPLIFSEFLELHGDRCFADDQAIAGGFAKLGNARVMLIGTNRSKEAKGRDARRFGMANPEGYRKALRLMKLAEKYGLPVIFFIDSPGAYPGDESESRGIHEVLATKMIEMSRLETVIICAIIGEAGNAGALAIGGGDVLLMQSHAIFSVFAPENYGLPILRDGSKPPHDTELLQLTAPYLCKLGIVDEVIEEPLGGAHRDYKASAKAIKTALEKHLGALQKMAVKQILKKRTERYERIADTSTSLSAGFELQIEDVKGQIPNVDQAVAP
jgi:acetyl-CoA carboxylase carboxyl transferase subunit alpha